MPNTLMNDKPISTHGTPAVHLSLQGKGGAGKSLIASFLAQYYEDRGINAVCVDTDPMNHTFAQYRRGP
jgi:adenylylsulfate kinase-like enzyme